MVVVVVVVVILLLLVLFHNILVSVSFFPNLEAGPWIGLSPSAPRAWPVAKSFQKYYIHKPKWRRESARLEKYTVYCLSDNPRVCQNLLHEMGTRSLNQRNFGVMRSSTYSSLSLLSGIIPCSNIGSSIGHLTASFYATSGTNDCTNARRVPEIDWRLGFETRAFPNPASYTKERGNLWYCTKNFLGSSTSANNVDTCDAEFRAWV